MREFLGFSLLCASLLGLPMNRYTSSARIVWNMPFLRLEEWIWRNLNVWYSNRSKIFATVFRRHRSLPDHSVLASTASMAVRNPIHRDLVLLCRIGLRSSPVRDALEHSPEVNCPALSAAIAIPAKAPTVDVFGFMHPARIHPIGRIAIMTRGDRNDVDYTEVRWIRRLS